MATRTPPGMRSVFQAVHRPESAAPRSIGPGPSGPVRAAGFTPSWSWPIGVEGLVAWWSARPGYASAVDLKDDGAATTITAHFLDQDPGPAVGVWRPSSFYNHPSIGGIAGTAPPLEGNRVAFQLGVGPKGGNALTADNAPANQFYTTTILNVDATTPQTWVWIGYLDKGTFNRGLLSNTGAVVLQLGLSGGAPRDVANIGTPTVEPDGAVVLIEFRMFEGGVIGTIGSINGVDLLNSPEPMVSPDSSLWYDVSQSYRGPLFEFMMFNRLLGRHERNRLFAVVNAVYGTNIPKL